MSRHFPEFLVRAADRAQTRVPVRFRKLVQYTLTIAAVLFVAFELSRVWIVSRDYLAPYWHDQFGVLREYAEAGNWLALLLSAVFFFLPFVVFAAVLRKWKRRKV